jgi:hypothetical protein
VLPCEGDHFFGGVDSDNAALGDASGDLTGDFSLSAANVEHALGFAEIKKRQGLFGHGSLQRGDTLILGGVPFGHQSAPIEIRSKQQAAEQHPTKPTPGSNGPPGRTQMESYNSARRVIDRLLLLSSC